MLSAIYNPQNVYCIAVDNKAEEKFRNEVNLQTNLARQIFYK